MEYSPLFVTLMGIGTVFFGLICIIFLTMAMGAVLKGKEKTSAVAAAAPAAAAPAPKPQGMQPEILAAITAALSEEIGIPSRSMNIVNIKKI
ncbi:MAG: OadG family protein [Oscillospiraceae bacterium]